MQHTPKENAMSDAMTVTLELPFTDSVEKVRAALQEQGFGVLTEIDVSATLKAKLGEEMEDYLILGACNPPLAHRALDVDRSLGLLLPCNVVLRATKAGTLVEIADPEMMVELTSNSALDPIAKEAKKRLMLVLTALGG
jgi:uncharacterized protein (DUF302 family)